MAKRQGRPKYRKLIGFLYIGIAAILIYALSMNVLRVFEQRNEYKTLVEKRDTLAKEKKRLSKEIELLSDDDYVTRYARDNYIFSKDGEEVVKLPEK